MNAPTKPTLSTESALFIGDTHGDAGWLKSVVLRTAVKMGIGTIIQVGDFGYWPESRKFMQVVKTARERYGIGIWFIEGNHEHFTKLYRDVRAAQVAAGVPEGNRDPVELAPGLVYLPRGSRVSMAGRSVACVGGAASINRADLIVGTSWFPEERINDSDIEAVKAGGHADILITHDAPSGWDIPGLSRDSQRPNSWILEMPSCDEHRERVREVLELVAPSVLIHGHYHAAYEKTHIENFGRLKTYGLDRNTHRGWGVIMREVDGELSFRWVDDDS
jgi:Icc-related predicted phosphoesterase